jgi:thioredoxin reductase
MQHDVIIVGGSYAGLAATLQLARARRRVLVIDEGMRRNRFATTSHGFLGHDGRAPGDIIAEAREQLSRYPTVEFLEARANSAEALEDGFAAEAGGERHTAKRLLLATGVRDGLPDITGLSERWGKSVFHCPYCHGYELDQGEIAVIATSDHSMHQALMLPDWGHTTLILNDGFSPDEQQQAQLSRRNVTVIDAAVTALSDHATIHFADGRSVDYAGIFVLPEPRQASPLAEQLGCQFDEDGMFPVIKTGFTQETSVSGVFACGDAARPAGSVSVAVGDGNVAGAAVHQSLIFRELQD